MDRPDSSHEGFDELAERHWPDAFRFCLALTGDVHDAEDLAQEAMLRALRGFVHFRREASFRTWLFSIILAVRRDGLRRRRRWLARRDRVARPDAVADAGLAHVDAADTRRRILECIRDLPDRQREVLALHVVEGLSYEQIAERLGISYNDVKVNLFHARRRLKERMG